MNYYLNTEPINTKKKTEFLAFCELYDMNNRFDFFSASGQREIVTSPGLTMQRQRQAGGVKAS